MFVKPSSAFVGCPSVVCSSSGSAKNARYARLFPSTRKSSASRAGPSSRTSSSPVSVFGTLPTLVFAGRPPRQVRRRRREVRHVLRPRATPRGTRGPYGLAAWMTTVRRVPLLSGSRIVHVPLRDDDVVLRPPPPPTRVVDVVGAVRDALRFPLDGAPLADLARVGDACDRRRRAGCTPTSRSPGRPRREALATVLDELASRGVPDERQTLLVAGGLSRKLAHRDLERLLPPPQARAFRGRVVVHDAADPDLVPAYVGDGSETRVNRALVDADLVVVLSSAETVSARRPCGAARGLRRRDDPPRRRGGLARPGCGRAGLGARARSRGGTPLARSAARSLARPRSPSADGSVPRLPVDAGVADARVDVAAATDLLGPAGRSPPGDSQRAAPRAGRCRRLRRHAVGRARRGARAHRRTARHAGRRAARRPRRRRPVDRAAHAPRAPQPGHVGFRRSRARAQALA